MFGKVKIKALFILYIHANTQEYLPKSGLRFDGSGVNAEESMAFGITDTRCGLTVALNTVFSLLNDRDGRF